MVCRASIGPKDQSLLAADLAAVLVRARVRSLACGRLEMLLAHCSQLLHGAQLAAWTLVQLVCHLARPNGLGSIACFSCFIHRPEKPGRRPARKHADAHHGASNIAGGGNLLVLRYTWMVCKLLRCNRLLDVKRAGREEPASNIQTLTKAGPLVCSRSCRGRLGAAPEQHHHHIGSIAN